MKYGNSRLGIAIQNSDIERRKLQLDGFKQLQSQKRS